MELTFKKAKRLRELVWEMRDVDFDSIKLLTSRIDTLLESLIPQNYTKQYKEASVESFLCDYANMEHFHRIIEVRGYEDEFKTITSVIQKILKSDKETSAKKYFKKEINSRLRNLFGDEMFEAIRGFTLDNEEIENGGQKYYLCLQFEDIRGC